MGESDGEVIERITRENMMLRALVAQLEARLEPEAMKRDARIAELERENESLRATPPWSEVQRANYLVSEANDKVRYLERLLAEARSEITRLEKALGAG